MRRFANAQTRDIQAFNQYSDWIFANDHTRDDEMQVARDAGAMVAGACSSTSSATTARTTR